MGRRGRFISFEGGEGSGKSTQMRLLADALRAEGHDVVATREPGGSDGAEAIRALLLEGGADRWGRRTEALLFAAARSDHVERVIKPAMSAGAVVLCDRFVDSSRAYQGGDPRSDPEKLSDDAILRLHHIGSNGLLPDLTILLLVDQQEAARRVGARGLDDRIGRRGLANHQSLQSRFLRLARAEPERFRPIDANRSAHEVHAEILAAVRDLL